MMDFGKLIKERRQALGLTLEQVGDACGVGKSTVRKWETGTIKNTGRSKIALLAKVLRLNPADLVLASVEAPDPVKTPDEDRLEALHQNPRLGLLFDRARKMSDEDIDFMVAFADRIMKERDGDD